MDGNWAPARVRRNFRIDLTSAILGGAYISVVVTFMPIYQKVTGTGSNGQYTLWSMAAFVVTGFYWPDWKQTCSRVIGVWR